MDTKVNPADGFTKGKNREDFEKFVRIEGTEVSLSDGDDSLDD
jgi:hypothetical protein